MSIKNSIQSFNCYSLDAGITCHDSDSGEPGNVSFSWCLIRVLHLLSIMARHESIRLVISARLSKILVPKLLCLCLVDEFAVYWLYEALNILESFPDTVEEYFSGQRTVLAIMLQQVLRRGVAKEVSHIPASSLYVLGLLNEKSKL